MRLMNLGIPVQISPLNEAMAIEAGGNFLAEAIVFGTAASLTIAEYARSKVKEASKERILLDHIEELSDRLKDTQMETIRQDAQIRELNQLLLSLSGLSSKQIVQSPDPAVVAVDKPSVSSIPECSNKKVELPNTIQTVSAEEKPLGSPIVQEGNHPEVLAVIQEETPVVPACTTLAVEGHKNNEIVNSSIIKCALDTCVKS